MDGQTKQWFAWDENQLKCVPIDGEYQCCNAEGVARECAEKGFEYDAGRCECKENTCGFDENGMCGGTCSDEEDVCMGLSYRGGGEDDFMGCGCCPRSLIDACEKAGGKIGTFSGESCLCYDAECGPTDREGFFVEGAMCGGKCSDTSDGASQSCVEAQGECRCCPSEDVKNCEDAGGTLAEDCECIIESTTSETETISETTISVGDEVSSTSFDDEVITSIGGGDGGYCDGSWFEGPSDALLYCCPRDVVDSCQGRIEVQVLMAGHECVCVDDTFSSTMK